VRRPELGLFALVLGAYAYFYQAGGWNQNSRFDMVRAIVEQGTSRIDRYAGNTGDLAIKVPLRPPRRPVEVYCDKAPGQQWLAVPPYALAHALADARPSRGALGWSAWFITVGTVAVPSAIAAVFLALLLGAWGVSRGWACAAAAAWSLATLAWPYGTLFYGHQTTASFLLIGFALIAMRRDPSSRRLAIAGLVLGAAVAVEYPAALACVVIGIYAIVVHGWRRSLWIAAGAVPAALAVLAYHLACFEGGFPYDFSNQGNRSKGFFMGIGVPDPHALWQLLGSSYRGLFFSAPWLLLAIPGGVVLARAGRRAEAIACAAIALVYLWLNASLVDWQGGWAMGPRYLVPCLPFVVLLASGLLVAPPRRFARALAGVALALVAYSGAAMLAGTAVKPEVPIQIKHPFGDFLWPHLARGELAISTQGIDMKANPPRAPRAAWNLGDRIGLRGLASLAPLALWMIACAMWIRHRARGLVSTS